MIFSQFLHLASIPLSCLADFKHVLVLSCGFTLYSLTYNLHYYLFFWKVTGFSKIGWISFLFPPKLDCQCSHPPYSPSLPSENLSLLPRYWNVLRSHSLPNWESFRCSMFGHFPWCVSLIMVCKFGYGPVFTNPRSLWTLGSAYDLLFSHPIFVSVGQIWARGYSSSLWYN